MVFRPLAAALAVTALLLLPASASATSPWACIDIYDGFMTPTVGVEHDVFALCSFDGDGHDLVRYDWDLDGDGLYETTTGTTPHVAHTWNDRAAHLDATVDVGVQVTDAAGEVGEWSEPLRLTDEINSWFTFEPQLVNPGDAVDLTAYLRPNEVDQREWTYEWDFDGLPGYEHSTGLLPHASFTAPDEVGARAVGLRVTDDLGRTSVVRRNVEILPRHPSRDQIAYEAPKNLLDAPPPSDTLPVPPGPVGPAAAPEVTPLPAERRVRRPRLKSTSADRRGLSLRYVGGPKWSRWKVTVSVPADRAASYGLPHRKVVLARGTIRFDRRGVGRTGKMRWTRGAYALFRKVRNGTLDIWAKRVA